MRCCSSPGHVTIEVEEERQPEAVRFTYTVHYMSASNTVYPDPERGSGTLYGLSGKVSAKR